MGGAAIAAFAGANAWKAESCGEKNIPATLSEDCVQMAVKMQPILVKAKVITDTELFLPVSLKCPSENGGTLELVSKNILGQAERVRLSYSNRDTTKPLKVALAAAEKGGAFEDIANVDMGNLADDSEKMFAKVTIDRGQPLLEKVCLGPKKERDRYLASLKANRESLVVSASNNSGNDDATMEAL
jgi:hypothetical protein